MIRSLHLQNFKSISSKTPLRLNNLSIISGANSSGKSTLIQSLLMMSQTFSARYFKSSVSLNGRLVRLGSFSDIIDHASKDDFINICIEMDIPTGGVYGPNSGQRCVELSLKFSGRGEKVKGFEGDFHPEVIEGSVRITNADSSVEYIKFGLPEKSNEENFSVIDLESKSRDVLSKDFPDYKIEGASRQDLIPYNIYINYDHTKKISNQLVAFLIGSQGYLKSLKNEELSDLGAIEIPRSVVDKIRSLVEQESHERISSFELPSEILKLIDSQPNRLGIDIEVLRSELARQSLGIVPDMLPKFDGTDGVSVEGWRSSISALSDSAKRHFFDFLVRNRDVIQGTWYKSMKKTRRKERFSLMSFRDLDHGLSFFFDRNVKYLGPLRNEPQAMYQAFDLADPTTVGLRGEYTAAVYHINKSNKIDYTGISFGDGCSVSFVKKRDTLAVACAEWLEYLGVVTEVQTYDKGKLGYELRVKTTNDDCLQDLTHVGVGVSQVLPIVVMALLSSSKDILIFEQPELHLHPKVQSRLCDFLLAISGGDRQCIVETHSEYVINRLRLRAAQSRNDEFIKRSSIVFAEKASGKTVFKPVDISIYGAIVNWPKDFFDQTDVEIENILIEASKKKRELMAYPKNNKS